MSFFSSAPSILSPSLVHSISEYAGSAAGTLAGESAAAVATSYGGPIAGKLAGSLVQEGVGQATTALLDYGIPKAINAASSVASSLFHKLF